MQEDSRETLHELRESTDETSEEIYKQFKEFLSSPQSRARIVNWIANEIPDPEDMTSWDITKSILYSKTSDRISKELAIWEAEQEIVKTLRGQLLVQIKLKLNLLEEEMAAIDHDMQSDIDRPPSPNDASQLRRTSTRRSTLPAISLGMIDELPVGFVAQYLHPLGDAFRSLVQKGS